MQVKEILENEKIICRLTTSADYCSSGEIDRRSFHGQEQRNLIWESKMVSGGVGRLGSSACPFKGRRRGDGIKQEEDKEDGEKLRYGYCE